jgi:hypothetical protein
MTRYRASIIVAQLLISAALAFAIISTIRILVAHGEERATFTDRNGAFAGSSITRGNKTDFYDARGRYDGTATQQSRDQSHPLGNIDGSKPFGSRK